MQRIEAGAVFALFGIEAWTEENNERISLPGGLWILEDRVFADRTCGQYDTGWWIFSATSEKESDDDSAPMFFVSDDSLREQADPKGYGRGLVQDREMDFLEEKQDEMEKALGF